MGADPDGHFWHIIAGALLGGIISAGVNVVMQKIEGNEEVNPYEVLIAGLAGAASGALPGLCSGGFGLFAGNMAISMAENLAGQLYENGGFNNSSIANMLFDGVTGLIGGSTDGAKHLNRLGIQSVKRTANVRIHQGVVAGTKEGKKAIAYYVKNSRFFYKPLLKNL